MAEHGENSVLRENRALGSSHLGKRESASSPAPHVMTAPAGAGPGVPTPIGARRPTKISILGLSLFCPDCFVFLQIVPSFGAFCDHHAPKFD